MSEWQPIETAPRDGSKFLAYTHDSEPGAPIFNVRIQEAWREGSDSKTGYFACATGQMITHWMPLPPSPDAAMTTARDLLAELRAHATAYPSAIEADQGFDCEDWMKRVCAELATR